MDNVGSFAPVSFFAVRIGNTIHGGSVVPKRAAKRDCGRSGASVPPVDRNALLAD